MIKRVATSVVNYFEDLQGGGPVRGKFVVIEDAREWHLVFGPLDPYEYHAHLVERFCNDHQIASSWARRPDVVEIHDPSLAIHGGGMIELDAARAVARFFGASKAYGFHRRSDIGHFVAQAPFFDGFTVDLAD